MTDFIDFILAHGEEILLAILGTQLLAQLIVNLTPTPRDDVIVGKVYKVIEKIAGVWSRTAKELPGERA